jgi:hypothetical protein
MLEDCFGEEETEGEEEEEEKEEEEEQQQQPQTSEEVAITNSGQRNQPNCPAFCVLVAAKERAQCTSAPDVTWAGLCVVPCFAKYHTKVNL